MGISVDISMDIPMDIHEKTVDMDVDIWMGNFISTASLEIAPKRLKLRTSDLALMFPSVSGQSRHCWFVSS